MQTLVGSLILTTVAIFAVQLFHDRAQPPQVVEVKQKSDSAPPDSGKIDPLCSQQSAKDAIAIIRGSDMVCKIAQSNPATGELVMYCMDKGGKTYFATTYRVHTS